MSASTIQSSDENGPPPNGDASRVTFTAGKDGKPLGGSYFHPSHSSFSVLSGSSKMPSHILAEELIMKGTKKKTVIGQTIGEFYASVTHIHFGAFGILGDIEPLQLCTNLRVLYLYENRLTSLKGIGSLTKLTHLYAQDNRIDDLSDFEAPASLEQLFLGGNQLSVIQGLDGCASLAELHVENQKRTGPRAAATALGASDGEAAAPDVAEDEGVPSVDEDEGGSEAEAGSPPAVAGGGAA